MVHWDGCFNIETICLPYFKAILYARLILPMSVSVLTIVAQVGCGFLRSQVDSISRLQSDTFHWFSYLIFSRSDSGMSK